jgi:DNA invertase Pin-like site-specific DNA recombinase
MSPANRKKPIIPYLRQSKAKEQTISIEDQRRDIERWAEFKGVQLAPEVIEGLRADGTRRDASGAKSWRDRELGDVIERCKRGDASGVIVAYQSRLTRENGLGTAEVYDALAASGARLVCVAENIDTWGQGDPDDTEMFFTIQAAIARREWKRSRANWRKGQDAAMERGVHVGARIYGYDKTREVMSDGKPGPALPLKVNPAEAAVVQEIFRRRANGQATDRELAELLSKAVGKPVNRGRVRHMLSNRAYLGEIRLERDSGEVYHKRDAHEAIVDAATFQRAQRGRGRRGPVSRKPRRPLADVLRCESGHRMVEHDNGRSRFYTCGNRDVCDVRASVSVGLVERYVLPLVLERYMGLSEEQRTPEDRTAELEAAVEAARTNLADVEALKGQIAPAAWGKALSAAYEELDGVEQGLAEYTPPSSLPPKTVLDQLWELLARDEPAGLEQIRGLVNEVVERVEVKMGRLPVEEKLTIRFKDGDVFHMPTTETLVRERELPVQERVETLELLQRRRARRARRGELIQ